VGLVEYGDQVLKMRNAAIDFRREAPHE
jgi:hypothetical protein